MIRINRSSDTDTSGDRCVRGPQRIPFKLAFGYVCLALLATFGCLGCGSYEEVSFGGIGPKFVEPEPIPVGKAVIYFYRLRKFYGHSASIIVKVNDVEGVVVVTNGGWYDYVVAPGRCDISDRPGIAFASKYKKDLSVDLKAGEACYIRFQSMSFSRSMSGLSSGFDAVMVPPEQALREMAGLGKFSVAGGVKPIFGP